MKPFRFTIFLCLFFPSVLRSQPHNPFLAMPVRMVTALPADTGNRIVVISVRNFEMEKGYRLVRGLQPSLQLSWFRVTADADTALAHPAADPAGALAFLPANRNTLIYVDGHGKTFEQVIERGLMLSKRFNLNLVVFDWPTNYVALRKTARNADEVAVAFTRSMRVIDQVHRKTFPETSVSVIFHSMGNHILKNIVDQRFQSYLPPDMFDNLILNAAAVKQANHARWIEKLQIQSRIYITMNDEDRPLKGATLLRLARQLGRGFYGRSAENAIYIDFSEVAGTEHNLFIGRSQVETDYPQIFGFYKDAFHGLDMQPGRSGGFRKASGQLVYHVVPKPAETR